MDRRDYLVLAAVLATVGGLAAVGPAAGIAVPAGAGGPTDVDGCTTITRPGTYVLSTDVDNAGNTAISQACVEIVADDVTFDGGGHSLTGRGESHTRAVAVIGADNVTVRDVAVDDWHYGVLVENGSATVGGVRSFSNAYGVRFENAGGSVNDTTLADNLVGIDVRNGSVDLADNDFSDNEIRTRGDNATVERDGNRPATPA